MNDRRVIVDHVSLFASDHAVSVEFYTSALAPLGFTPRFETGASVSYGVDGLNDFTLEVAPEDKPPTSGAHVAFVARDAEAVDRFYEAAVAAGGRGLAPPAVHPEYSDRYYAAYVADPDANNVEAVFHADHAL